MTNYEKRKNMSVEEMAKFIVGKRDCQMCMRAVKHLCSSKVGNCNTGVIEWLNKEVSE